MLHSCSLNTDNIYRTIPPVHLLQKKIIMKNIKKFLATTGVACVTAGFLVAGPASPATAATVYPDSIASMGDSISRAASTNPGSTSDVTANSWSTGSGTKVNSHYNRIKAASGTTATANAAKSGSTSADLVRQANLVVSNRAQYVTIISGGNDICGASSIATMTSAATYKNNMRNALKTLGTSPAKPKVLLASSPSLLDLYKLGVNSAAAKRVWVGGNICPIMFSAPDDKSTTANNRRNSVEQRMQAYNTAAKEVCAEFSFCAFDDGAVYNIDLQPADISTVDYFHPSVAGQNKIANVTWAKAVTKIFSQGTASAPNSETSSGTASPVVNVISPTSEKVSGNVAVKVTASSDSSIKSVYIKIDGQPNVPMTRSGSFWVASLNTSSYPNGTTFYPQFVATDSDGDSSVSSKYKMVISN